MSDKKYISFIDNAGRALFGVLKDETDTTVSIQSPVMIGVQQQDTGRMAVQLYPLFFAEFVVPTEGNETRQNAFIYHKSSIAVGDGFEVDPRIVAQYEKVANPVLVSDNTPETEPEVIKLFDE